MFPCLSQFAWGFLDHLWSTLRQFRQLLTRQSWSNAENVDGLPVWMDSIIYILSGMFCDWSSCMHEWTMCIPCRLCLHGWAMLFKLSSYELCVCVCWDTTTFTCVFFHEQLSIDVKALCILHLFFLSFACYKYCFHCAWQRVGRRVIVFQDKRMRRFLFRLICVPHSRVVNTHGKVWKRQKNCVCFFLIIFTKWRWSSMVTLISLLEITHTPHSYGDLEDYWLNKHGKGTFYSFTYKTFYSLT